MDMDIQTIVVLLLFTAAVSYLAWRGYRSLAAKQTGCSKGCGCEADATKTKRSTLYR